MDVDEKLLRESVRVATGSLKIPEKRFDGEALILSRVLDGFRIAF